MAKEEEKRPVIKAQKASPEAVKWHEYQLATRQKEPERIEDAAKFLSGMISISLTLFLKINPDTFRDSVVEYSLMAAVVFWLLSLVFSFLVLFPVPFRYNRSSAEDIERMHVRSVNYKYFWLMFSAGFFVVALGILTWKYISS
jgi:hypothetical protein